jgi:poly(3-hydroxybutyrate) depolymerase
MPAIIVHGDRDHVVSPANAHQLARQWLHLNWPSSVGAANTMPAVGIRGRARSPTAQCTVLALGTDRQYERTDYRRNGKPLVRVCMIRKVGHAWSGGDAKLKFNSAEGPKASLLMWQFFRMHQRATGEK